MILKKIQIYATSSTPLFEMLMGGNRMQKKKKKRGYKKEILHLPGCSLSVCPPSPFIPPKRNGEFYPAFPDVFMDASHAECCSVIFEILPPPPAMIKGLLSLATNVPPPPEAVSLVEFLSGLSPL